MRRIGMSLVIGMAVSGRPVATHLRAVGWPVCASGARFAGTALLVPAYFYPAGERLADWKRLAEAARRIPLEVILNPASGPGPRPDPNYAAVIAELKASGARILAYVDSDYGRRPLAAVEKDLRTYSDYYRIDGFFIDQMANTPEAVDYYRAIRRSIRRLDPRLKVVGNPGAVTRPEYLETADTLVTFEGLARSFADYDPRAVAPWASGHSPGRFAAIVYGVRTAPAGRAVLAHAERVGTGSIYITDQGMPNPYLGLPPYWDDEVAAIRAKNRARGRRGHGRGT